MKHLSIIPLIALVITVSALAQAETSREALRNEMRKRPDDLWPRGEGHVVLAIPGSLEAEKSYLEPGGGFSPAFGTFGVSIWVTSPSADKTWSCDTLPLSAIRQSFVDGKAPSIVTKTDDYELTHTINATGDSSIRVKNTSSAGNTLSLVVRSAGPAGNPVKKLSWDGTDLIINDNWHVSISPKPDSVTMGDETQEGWKKLDGPATQFTSEGGWGFARIRLGKGDYTVRMTTAEKSVRSPIGYGTMASTLKIQLPDERFARSLNAQVAHLMMGVVRDECRPGEPNNYPLPWLRDGAYQLLALARSGQIDAAKTLALYFAKNDFFGGFGPEGDAPGLGIWGIMQVAYEVNDPSFYQELWPHVQRKVEWIQKMRATKESIRLPITCPIIEQTKRSPDGDLVCEAARDGLIIGRMDWHRPLLFINAANFSGLKHAARLAAITGHDEEAKAWKHEADTLQQAWLNVFDKESGNERTFICSLWPDWIGQPIQSKFAEKALSNWKQIHDSTGDYKALPLWTYFDFASAHQWLFMQQPEYTWKTLEWFWQHQCAPGLYSWWEGNGEENSSGRWNNVRGWVKPKHVTPHYWTAAMALALQLDMLAFLDDHGPEPVVVIGEGVKPEWLSQPMKVEGIHLHGNTINWQWDGKTLHVSMRGAKMKIKAGSPFGENAKMDIEYIN